jgi:stringent starvation protein B
LHEWCTDNGFTPYLAVYVDRSVQVPQEYVKNNEIVLNVSFEATSSLQLGNDFIEFKARFGGMARDISVPVDHVIAIYARENGQGMAFPVPTSLGGDGVDSPASPDDGADMAAMLMPGVAAEAPEDRTPGLRLARAPKANAGDEVKLDSSKDRPAMKSVETDPALRPAPSGDEPPDTPPSPTGGGRPALRRIK